MGVKGNIRRDALRNLNYGNMHTGQKVCDGGQENILKLQQSVFSCVF